MITGTERENLSVRFVQYIIYHMEFAKAASFK